MQEIKIKAERENFKLPVIGTEEAACYDVYASRIEHKEDGMVICYLGFSTEIPKGFKGVVIPRSNISKYSWVMANSPGIIDSDYRGEWRACFRPLPVYRDGIIDMILPIFPYKENERVAQIYFEKEEKINFKIVTETSDTQRGLGGFGSTGLE